VAPDRPETGYGYIELGQPSAGVAFAVKKFHEKPDLAAAKTMLDSGHFVWNAGIFLFRASAMMTHAKNLVPEMLVVVKAAIDGAREDNNFWHIQDEA